MELQNFEYGRKSDFLAVLTVSCVIAKREFFLEFCIKSKRFDLSIKIESLAISKALELGLGFNRTFLRLWWPFLTGGVPQTL